MSRYVFHVDVNSAFLSWSAVHRHLNLGEATDLRTIPSIVGGDQESRHGIVLAKSVAAKKYNIQTGEPIIDAIMKCPHLVIIPPDYGLYVKASRAFISKLQEYKVCHKLGLELSNNHAFRMALNSYVYVPMGLPVTERAKLLGHSVDTNLKHYTFARTDEYLEEISAQIDAFYANDRKTEDDTEKGTLGYPNIIEFRSKEKSPKPSTVRAFS